MEFTARLKAHNAEWRQWITDALQSNAIRVPPSQGNFVLALFQDTATAKAAFTALRDKGLLVREMHGYSIPEGLRISIGLGEDMRAVVDVLKDFGAPGGRD
jgi:histidinol-phosphate aminotransferase